MYFIDFLETHLSFNVRDIGGMKDIDENRNTRENRHRTSVSLEIVGETHSSSLLLMVKGKASIQNSDYSNYSKIWIIPRF